MKDKKEKFNLVEFMTNPNTNMNSPEMLGFGGAVTDDEEIQFSREDKRAFLQAVKQLSMLQQHIYRSRELEAAATQVKGIVDVAERLTKQETADWFDATTVKRHLKYLKNAEKEFNKAVKENMQTQVRLEAAFEDIVDILKKYYEVG